VRDFREELLEDLLSQFDGKPNIEILNRALGKQLQKVYDFFVQLWKERHFPDAVGQQLGGKDGLGGIGDIVVLNRQQALIVARLADMDVDMEDEMYRVMLAWKIFLNTSWTKYKEVHRLITMLWKASPMIYSEDPNWPATIFFDTPLITIGQWLDFRVLHIAIKVKAAGVQLIFRVRIKHDMDDIPVVIGMVNNHAVKHGSSPAKRSFDTQSQTGMVMALVNNHVISHGSSPADTPFCLHQALIRMHDGSIEPAYVEISGKIMPAYLLLPIECWKVFAPMAELDFGNGVLEAGYFELPTGEIVLAHVQSKG